MCWIIGALQGPGKFEGKRASTPDIVALIPRNSELNANLLMFLCVARVCKLTEEVKSVQVSRLID